RAVYTGQGAEFRWEYDDQTYSLSALCTKICEVFGAEVPASFDGPDYWRLEGDSLSLTGRAIQSLPSGGFDWSPIDAAIAVVPAGKWTSYADLAELGGTSALAVGQHVARGGPHTGYRVLGSDGHPRENFRWDDPTDTRSQQEALSE